MADITRAFANLNRSLRHISDSRRLKEQAEMQHQEKMAQLDEKINDPQRQLKQQQDAEEMKLTSVGNYMPTSNSTTDRIFNENVLTPGINKIVNQYGMDYKDGQYYNTGTNDVAKRQQWKMRKINSSIQKYVTLSNLPTNRDAMRLSNLEERITASSKSSESGDIHAIKEQGIKELKRQRDDLQTKLNDPEYQLRQLKSDRVQLKDTYKSAITETDNPELVKNIQNMLNINGNDIQELSGSGKVARQVSHVYHKKTKDGWITRKFYDTAGQPVPKKRGEWLIGSKPEMKGSKSETAAATEAKKLSNISKITIAKAKEQNMRSDYKVVIGDMASAEYLADFVKNRRGTHTEGQIEFDRLQGGANKEKLSADYKEFILSHQRAYYNVKGYWLGRIKEKKAFEKRWAAYAKENDLDPSLKDETADEDIQNLTGQAKVNAILRQY